MELRRFLLDRPPGIIPGFEDHCPVLLGIPVVIRRLA